jgi:hypothetical protein
VLGLSKPKLDFQIHSSASPVIMEVQDDDLDSQVLRDMAKGFMGDFDLKEEVSRKSTL